MDDLPVILLTLGALMMLGLVTDLLGRLTASPRVTLLIVFGFAIGPSGFGLRPEVGPALADTILPVVVAATVIFELAGPVLTRVALRRVGEDPLHDE